MIHAWLRTAHATVMTRPLFRLLAINLAAGMAIAALTVGGLLLANPHDLRHLIAADRSGALAVGLMLFGFVVTFGSCVMGTAIMLLGDAGKDRHGGRRAPAVLAPLPVRVTRRG